VLVLTTRPHVWLLLTAIRVNNYTYSLTYLLTHLTGYFVACGPTLAGTLQNFCTLTTIQYSVTQFSTDPRMILRSPKILNTFSQVARKFTLSLPLKIFKSCKRYRCCNIIRRPCYRNFRRPDAWCRYLESVERTFHVELDVVHVLAGVFCADLTMIQPLVARRVVHGSILCDPIQPNPSADRPNPTQITVELTI